MSGPRNAPPPLLGQAFFVDTQDDEGWSETYYLNATAYDVALKLLNDVVTSRLALVTPEIACVYRRVSALNLRGDTNVDDRMKVGTYISPTINPTQRCLPSRVCWLDRWDGIGPPVYHTIRLMHGVPRGLETTTGDDEFTPDGVWNAAYTNWTAKITANCQILLKTSSGPPPVWTAKTINTTQFSSKLRGRKVGRPFGLQRGRRAIV